VHVYSSALQRAHETAAALAGWHGLPHTVRGELHEIAFGDWEDMTPAQIAERFPDQWRSIIVEGNDLPRGKTGETMEGAGRRIAGVVSEIAVAHPGDKVAVVSHGGAIRAYLCGQLGVPFRGRSVLDLPENTSVSHVRFAPGGPVMVDYNVVPGQSL
jgi:broad specificity phosphatase PhoE